MKSIDKLNNAVIRQGKKAVKSKAGQKFVNSGAGQKIKDTVYKAAEKNKFVGDLTGINLNKASDAADDALRRLQRMQSSPTFSAYQSVVNTDLNKLREAEARAIQGSKRLQKLEGNPQKYDKFKKKLAKHTKQERMNYEQSRDQFESLPAYKTYRKIKSDHYDSVRSFEKATRDTRNSRRALTGGVLTTGIVAPPVIHRHNKKKQEQEELNRIRMSYM